jgi:hypothetical protein
MADITMCKGVDNPMCVNCYRKNATPNEYRQSYFIEPPMIEGQCDEYWHYPKTDNQIKKV